jgi:hypothetical protein
MRPSAPVRSCRSHFAVRGEGQTVSDPDVTGREESPGRGGGSALDVDAVIARAQWLADAHRPWDGYPLEWHVEAWMIGDLNAIAIASLRKHQP